jgi:hypothetical protein
MVRQVADCVMRSTAGPSRAVRPSRRYRGSAKRIRRIGVRENTPAGLVALVVVILLLAALTVVWTAGHRW